LVEDILEQYANRLISLLQSLIPAVCTWVPIFQSNNRGLEVEEEGLYSYSCVTDYFSGLLTVLSQIWRQQVSSKQWYPSTNCMVLNLRRQWSSQSPSC